MVNHKINLAMFVVLYTIHKYEYDSTICMNITINEPQLLKN